MTRVLAPAKVNLALVVGERRADGLHEVATVVQPVALGDELELEPAVSMTVEGFQGDTLVRAALERLAEAAGVAAGWRVRIAKRVPVAAGLGGGSADAAAALRAANETLAEPLPDARLVDLAASVGSDVPALVLGGTVLAEGGGERVRRVELPTDYAVVVALPHGARKAGTGDVYRRFDELGGAEAFGGRSAALGAALAARDLRALPGNDLAEAAGRPDGLLARLGAAGAFRADVSGAGPAVYGLFAEAEAADAAAGAVAAGADVWVTQPVC